MMVMVMIPMIVMVHDYNDVMIYDVEDALL